MSTEIPKKIDWEGFNHLKNLSVEFEQGPLYKVPEQSPRPPKPEPSEAAPRVRVPEPADPKNYAIQIWLGILLLIVLSIIFPKALQFVLFHIDDMCGDSYGTIWQLIVLLFKFALATHEITKLPNLDGFLSVFIGATSVILSCGFVIFFFSSGTMIAEKYEDELSKDWLDTLPYLPYVAFFGMITIWLVVHCFVAFLVSPIVYFGSWLMAPK